MFQYKLPHSQQISTQNAQTTSPHIPHHKHTHTHNHSFTPKHTARIHILHKHIYTRVRRDIRYAPKMLRAHRSDTANYRNLRDDISRSRGALAQHTRNSSSHRRRCGGAAHSKLRRFAACVCQQTARRRTRLDAVSSISTGERRCACVARVHVESNYARCSRTEHKRTCVCAIVPHSGARTAPDGRTTP